MAAAPEPSSGSTQITGENWLQLTLFSSEDERLTNTVALYDLAPRFVFFTEERKDRKYLDAIQRSFQFAGSQYDLVLTPARILEGDKEWDEYPGEREQLVEDVIRRLAVDRNRLRVKSKNEVVLTFTLYEIRRELARLKHSLRLDEIKRALTILSKSHIEITRFDSGSDTEDQPGGKKGKNKKGKSILHSSAFPVLAIRTQDDEDDAETFVQLNPLVAQSIRTMEFDQVNYEWMMRIQGPLSRWVFKRISIQLMNSHNPDTKLAVLKASDIAQCFGMARSRWRDCLRRIDTAMEALRTHGVAASIDRDEEFEGRKKTDITYIVHLTDTFAFDRHKARKHSEYNAGVINRYSPEGADDFIPVSAQDAAGIRHERRMTLAALEGPEEQE